MRWWPLSRPDRKRPQMAGWRRLSRRRHAIGHGWLAVSRTARPRSSTAVSAFCVPSNDGGAVPGLSMRAASVHLGSRQRRQALASASVFIRLMSPDRDRLWAHPPSPAWLARHRSGCSCIAGILLLVRTKMATPSPAPPSRIASLDRAGSFPVHNPPIEIDALRAGCSCGRREDVAVHLGSRQRLRPLLLQASSPDRVRPPGRVVRRRYDARGAAGRHPGREGRGPSGQGRRVPGLRSR